MKGTFGCVSVYVDWLVVTLSLRVLAEGISLAMQSFLVEDFLLLDGQLFIVKLVELESLFAFLAC